MKHIGINLCEVGPIDCDTNADGGYDCECNTGYSGGNGTYCESFLYALAFIFHLQILMSVLVVMIHVISMPHVSTLLVAMTVNVCRVSWEIDSIVQVIRF